MPFSIRLTILADNVARGVGLIAEHGFAVWVEVGERAVLFDTGQGLVILPNAARLGVALEKAESVLLSHGHFDHTGGLAAVLERAPRARIHAHPDVFDTKYHGMADGTARDIGMPAADAAALHARERDLVASREPAEVLPGIWLTGEIPRVTEYEDVGGPFFRDAAIQEPDPLLDDQALYFLTPSGTVVLAGCAHSGIVNTVLRVQELTRGAPVCAVIGGMHLVNAGPERVGKTRDFLRSLGLSLLVPGHCTGPRATAELWCAFPDIVQPCGTGSEFSFDAA